VKKRKNAVQQSGMAARLWRSIVPRIFTLTKKSDEERKWVFANSLILHLRPVSVPAKSLRYTHTFGLGGMSLVLILMLISTGLLMMFVYDPSPERAYQSILIMQQEILFGRLIRGIHYWSANLLIAVALLHMLRVFLTGAFHVPRQSNWLIGLSLLFLILMSGFTGYLLPWDQLSYWAITISTEMLAYVPGIGLALQRVILGGEEIGPATVINFYVTHTTMVPILLIVLMTWHFWRIRLAGGVVIPRDPADGPEPNIDYVPFVPNLLLRETVVALILIALVVVLAILFGAPLGEPANSGLSPNPAKAPWYFLGFQELLLHFHPLFAVFVIPLMLAIAVISIPYLRYDTDLSGNWFLSPKGRRMAAVAAATAVLLTPLWILIDEFVRGSGGWLPGAAPVISNGLLPCAFLAAAVVAFYLSLKRYFLASKNETVQALFVLLAVGFTILTVTGIWFRGAGMTLVWPWQA
jgi:quinol-cytochrome oxidoreductase complex cytochrome b subunit